MYITVDNAYEVWLNGQYVGGGQADGDWQNSDFTEPFVHTSGWQSVENYDVTNKIYNGSNTLTIVAANEYLGALDGQPEGTIDSNPAGVIFSLKVDSSSNVCEPTPQEPNCAQNETWNGEYCVPNEPQCDGECPVECASDEVYDELSETCLSDTDEDDVPDSTDNCPLNANSDQADADQDGIGDVCDDTPNGDELLIEQILENPGNADGDCSWDWSSNGNGCDKNEPRRYSFGQDENSGNDDNGGTGTLLPDEEEDNGGSSSDPNLLTGAVTGGGLLTSWLWLLIALALAGTLGGWYYFGRD